MYVVYLNAEVSDADFCKFFDRFQSKSIERTKINLIDNRKIDLSNKQGTACSDFSVF